MTYEAIYAVGIMGVMAGAVIALVVRRAIVSSVRRGEEQRKQQRLQRAQEHKVALMWTLWPKICPHRWSLMLPPLGDEHGKWVCGACGKVTTDDPLKTTAEGKVTG